MAAQNPVNRKELRKTRIFGLHYLAEPRSIPRRLPSLSVPQTCFSGSKNYGNKGSLNKTETLRAANLRLVRSAQMWLVVLVGLLLLVTSSFFTFLLFWLL